MPRNVTTNLRMLGVTLALSVAALGLTTPFTNAADTDTAPRPNVTSSVAKDPKPQPKPTPRPDDTIKITLSDVLISSYQ